jgi:glycogen synthase
MVEFALVICCTKQPTKDNKPMKKMRVAMPAWEIGRTVSGLGTKIGGLAVVVEELPPALVKAAAQQDIELEVETLTPCFAHYDKNRLNKLDLRLPVTIEGHTFEFDVYEHIFSDGQKVVYFWDQWQLEWTNGKAIYPTDPHLAIKLYAAIGQAMAAYIKQGDFNVVHMHDYHVGLTPFYLGDDYLRDASLYFTIHNATYQGVTPLIGSGYHSLDRINLPGYLLFHKYFDFFNNLSITKACMLKVHETGGKITTVSGDIAGTWGYAAELKENHDQVWHKAQAQKGSPPGEVFVSNRHLDLFEKLPIAGITNGMSDTNRAENLPWLKADVLQDIQKKQGPSHPIFRHPVTQTEMLNKDHTFDVERLETKSELKRLLHLECFGGEPHWDPILITAVGRLVAQKNLGLVADIIERTLAYDAGVKFVILASATDDESGKHTEGQFIHLAGKYPHRVYFNNSFNLPLSKLIFAGGDFMLIPSRFEPCGLVDYEASLVGNVVIGRATGGLTKVGHCAYLYNWLDMSDGWGEANAFFDQIRAAVDTYRHDRGRHDYLVRTAMSLDASWDKSATKYIDMYRNGSLVKEWHAARTNLLELFVSELGDNRDLFSEFFIPAQGEYADHFDWELRDRLERG